MGISIRIFIKAEIFGMVASSYPKLLERVWTCHTPINNKPCLNAVNV